MKKYLTKKYVLMASTGILGLLSVGLSGVITKYLPDDLFNKKTITETSKPTIYHQSSDKVAIIEKAKVLPNETKIPILDNTLYLERYYGSITLGGVNFNDLKYAVRTKDGAPATIKKSGKKSITYDVFQQPYFEIEYKNNFYIIELIVDTDGNWFEVSFSVKKTNEITMKLSSQN